MSKTKQFKVIKKLDLKGRTSPFLKLADRLRNLDQETIDALFEKAAYANPWFTRENIQLAFNGLMNFLDEEKLTDWLKNYNLNQNHKRKAVSLTFQDHQMWVQLFSRFSLKILSRLQ